jgi:hypothetical protein
MQQAKDNCLQQIGNFLHQQRLRTDRLCANIVTTIVDYWFDARPELATEAADLRVPGQLAFAYPQLFDLLREYARRQFTIQEQNFIKATIDGTCRIHVSAYRKQLFETPRRNRTPPPQPAPEPHHRVQTPDTPLIHYNNQRTGFPFARPALRPHDDSVLPRPGQPNQPLFRPIGVGRPLSEHIVQPIPVRPVIHAQQERRAPDDLERLRDQLIEESRLEDRHQYDELEREERERNERLQHEREQRDQQDRQDRQERERREQEERDRREQEQQDQDQDNNQPPVMAAYNPDIHMLQTLLSEIPKFDGSKVDEFAHSVEHALMACGIYFHNWVQADLDNQPLHDAEVAKGRRVLALIATRLTPPVQSRWRRYWGITHATVPQGADEGLGGEPITWTNAANTTPYGPSSFRTTHEVEHVPNAADPQVPGTKYPTLKQWLYATFPEGSAAVIVPESIKFHKIHWSKAAYNGSAEQFIGWVQTVCAIKKANRVPDHIPTVFGNEVTEAIAMHFTGVAAEAWLNTPDNLKPRHVGSADPNDNDQTRLIPWMRHRFRSPTHELVKHRELQTIKWDSKTPLYVFNEQFSALLMEAGYGLGRPVAETFKVEWYLNALPHPLAQRVRASIFSSEEQTREMNRLLLNAGRVPLPAYEPTLRGAQELAVKHQTDFQLHGRPERDTRRSSPQQSRGDNRRSTTPRSQGQQRKSCFKCGKEGHIAPDCRSTGPSQKRYCRDCDDTHEYGKHTKPRDGWCHKCKKVHPRGQCPPTKASYGASSIPTVPDVVATPEESSTITEVSSSTDTVPSPPTVALVATPPIYIVAQVDGHKARVVIDSGCEYSAISAKFLKTLGYKTEPSTRLFEQLAGEHYKSLGLVKDIALDIDGIEFFLSAEVVDTKGFDLVVGWRWICQYKGVIDSVNQEITLRQPHDILTVPLYGILRHPKPEAEQPPNPTASSSPPAPIAAFYGVSHEVVLQPPSKEERDEFLQKYIWIRLRMGQKHPNPLEDPTGLRCAAGRSFCRDCYRDLTDCEESRNSRAYWRDYACKEPAYWMQAATIIINSRRSTNSPLYHPCSDDWGLVFSQTWNALNPDWVKFTITDSDSDSAPDFAISDADSEHDTDSEYQTAHSSPSDGEAMDEDDANDDTASTGTDLVATYLNLSDSETSDHSNPWGDPYDEAAEYSSDPDWDWLTQEGYVTDTSENYEMLRPRKLLKPKPVPDDCGPDPTPWRDGSSEGTPPLASLSLDSPQSTSSSSPKPSPTPIPANQFWDTVSRLTQYKVPHNDFRIPSSQTWFSPLPRSDSPSKNTVFAYSPVLGWGDDESPWDQPHCLCKGWCSCPTVPATDF